MENNDFFKLTAKEQDNLRNLPFKKRRLLLPSFLLGIGCNQDFIGIPAIEVENYIREICVGVFGYFDVILIKKSDREKIVNLETNGLPLGIVIELLKKAL